MRNIDKILFALTACALPSTAINAEVVTMSTPANFEILSISPNGKWACGVYADAMMNTYAFRWDLQGGDILILDNETCVGWDVSNDGIVSGDFTDTASTPNGAPVTLPGYWRDGSWHSLEMPANTRYDGVGGGITADGHYMTGAVDVNGKYKPFIWKDGKIYKSLHSDKDAVAYTISPDGQSVGGYSTQYNRTACIWTSDNDLIFFEDSQVAQSPWNYARNFSPDGTKLLYWGGWQPTDDDELYLYCIYDINTGERIKVKAPSYDSDMEFFDISNNGLMVGYNGSRGYVYAQGEGMYFDDYLAMRGIDLSGIDDFYGGDDYYVGQLPITRIIAVSEDENLFAMNYYNKDGVLASMVMKLDQDLSALAPAAVKARQLSGLNTVCVTWQRPVGANSIRGYNIYRDGRKVNGILPVNVPYYYDKNVAEGSYTYHVSAVSVDGTETPCDDITVAVTTPKPQQPYAVYARQKGLNSGLVMWSAPQSNIVHKRYYDIEDAELDGMNVYEPVEVEMGIRYDKAELANYKGYTISEVSFCPMASHTGWTINIYTYDSDGTLRLIATQPVTQELAYRQINTVKLDNPVSLPDGDMIVAIDVLVDTESQVTLGSQNDIYTPGYSDLLRQKTEADFYSAYESSVSSGYTISCVSWAIDLGLQPAGYSEDDNTLTHYNIYVDGELATTTGATRYETGALVDGEHAIAIEAQYADGSLSPKAATTVSIATAYKGIDELTIDTGAEGSTIISSAWTAPDNCDKTTISYSTADKHALGIKGTSDNGYALMAGAEFPSSMMHGYDGYKLSAFRFYPLTDAIFTFMLYEDGQLACELEVDEYTLKQWNSIPVPDEVIINGNSEYLLVVDCFDPVPDTNVLAIDNDLPRSNVSDLYSINNGTSWGSISAETGANGNWMIGMDIETPEYLPMPIIGYDVMVDGKKANDALVTETEYVHDMAKHDQKMHTIKVNTYYDAVAEPIEGTTYYFRLSTAALDDTMVTNIKLERKGSYLVADGATALALYTPDGIETVAVQGDKICIDHLQAGIYVVKITTDAGSLTAKVNIMR